MFYPGCVHYRTRARARAGTTSLHPVPSFIKESIFPQRNLRFPPSPAPFFSPSYSRALQRERGAGREVREKKAWDTLMRFNNFSAVVVSLRFFAKCKLRERPGEFYKRIKAETVFSKRAYGNMKFQGVHGKRGAIQHTRTHTHAHTQNTP